MDFLLLLHRPTSEISSGFWWWHCLHSRYSLCHDSSVELRDIDTLQQHEICMALSTPFQWYPISWAAKNSMGDLQAQNKHWTQNTLTAPHYSILVVLSLCIHVRFSYGKCIIYSSPLFTHKLSTDQGWAHISAQFTFANARNNSFVIVLLPNQMLFRDIIYK